MINHLKLNIASTAFSKMQQEAPNAYEKLHALIKSLNEEPRNYDLVVHVISDDNLNRHKALYGQIQSLLDSLTRREHEVFELAINGFSNKAIADKLFITVETVKSHRKKIVNKAGVSKMQDIRQWMSEVHWL